MNNTLLSKMKIKKQKSCYRKNEVTLFKLNSLVCWLQGSEMKPTTLDADGYSWGLGKFSVMENYTTKGNVNFFGTVALHKNIKKVN